MRVSETDATEWLQRVMKARRDLVAAPKRKGYLRGVDALDSKTLSRCLRGALALFAKQRGRLPDLIDNPGFGDHYFAMKFFGFVPMPNPADKLNTARYLPEHLTGTLRVLPKILVSEEPRLPPDDAVPPGAYFLKCALGCKNLAPVRWPLSADERGELERSLRDWFRQPYGIAWGEWWYAWGKQRWFLEPDIRAEMEGQPQWSVFVRQGTPVLGHVITNMTYDSYSDSSQRYFLPDLTPIDATMPNRGLASAEFPAHLSDLIRHAGEIGKPFDIVRVDYWDTRDGPPVLAELTLCDMNARRRFEPPEFEDRATELVFG